MTKERASTLQKRFELLTRRISSRVPTEAKKYTSERIIHKIRYGTFSS